MLIGAQGGERIIAEDVAAWRETINYEVTCAVGARDPAGRTRGEAAASGPSSPRSRPSRATRGPWAAACATRSSAARVADLDVAVAGDAGGGRRAALPRPRRHPLPPVAGLRRVAGAGRRPARSRSTSRRSRARTSRRTSRRRDLTVNALAAAGRGRRADHRPATAASPTSPARRLRLVSADRPVRRPRAPAAPGPPAEQIGFAIDAGTVAARPGATRRASGTRAGERLADELGRIVSLPPPDRAFAPARRDRRPRGARAPARGVARAWTRARTTTRTSSGTRWRSSSTRVELADDPEPVFRGRAERVREVAGAPLADELDARAGALMLGALLHDMAKPATRAVTPEGRVTFMGHDRLGAEMADDLMRRLHDLGAPARVRGALRALAPAAGLHGPPHARSRCARSTATCAPRRPRRSRSSCSRSPTAWRPAGRAPAQSAIDRHLVLAREVMDAHFRLVDRGPQRPLVAGDELARGARARARPVARAAPRRAARGPGGGRAAHPRAGASLRPALGGGGSRRSVRPLSSYVDRL